MSSTEVELAPVQPAVIAASPATLQDNDNIINNNIHNNVSTQEPPTAASLEPVAPSKRRAAALMATLACVSFLNTFNSGTLTVSLPTIADDLGLPDGLLLWPASVYSLGLCCTLLLLGAVADLVGNRPVFLAGAALYMAGTLAVALARSGAQLIAFRALQGVAMAGAMPTAVSVITTTFPAGRMRNAAFATFGGGSPVGFATGLVLGGVFVKVSGWRASYYLATGVNGLVLVAAWFVLPKTEPAADLRRRFVHGFDWVGLAAASACLALWSYLFAEITHSSAVMKKPSGIAILVVAVLLIPFFAFWVGRQERLGRPAIVPNSIWRKREFTTVCVTVFLVWGWFNSFGYWATLFYQRTQHLDALGAALRFLPLVLFGLLTNVAVGLVIHRVSAGTLVFVGGVLSAIAPLLFAIQDPDWQYWVAAFASMCLSPISSDILFSVSNLVITSSFPSKQQAVAGSLFNTITQLGNGIGPAVTAMIAAAVTQKKMHGGDMSDAAATLEGYRSALWACFGAAVLGVGVGAYGLRSAGRVGQKVE